MRVILETERLILREFIPDDADAFFTLNSDPEVMRYLGDWNARTVEDARAELLARPIADYAKHGYGRWACIDKATGELIGFCGLKYLDEFQEPDLGYRFRPAWWGRGLATESGRAVCDFGFEKLGLQRILGLVRCDHARSIRVLEKLGFGCQGLITYFGAPAFRYHLERTDRRPDVEPRFAETGRAATVRES